MSDIVYFARQGAFVKIGTTGDLAMRLTNLTRGHSGLTGVPAGPVEVLATMPGGRPVERAIHQLFLNLHYAKEWFFWQPPLTDFVAVLLAAPTAKVEGADRPQQRADAVMTLREAVESKVLPLGFYAARKRLQCARLAGAPGVPRPVQVGQAYLYRVGDLVAWYESELIP